MKPIIFEECKLVLLKIYNFFGKNQKLVQTFKGPNIVIKGNENGTVKIKTKYAKHDLLINQTSLVKYKQPAPEPTVTPEIEHKKQSEQIWIPAKRTYTKCIFEGREDGSPIAGSKKKQRVEEINDKERGAAKNCKHQDNINFSHLKN